MKWIRLYTESNDTQTIPISVSTRELKLIQNYMNQGKPLNDPANKECLETVLRILQDLIKNSDVENLDTYIANYLYENFGINMTVDPYGKNSGIELHENGLIEMSACDNKDFWKGGEYADLIEGGFWDERTGKITAGFISVDDLNSILQLATLDNGIKSIKLKQDGYMVRIMMDI